MSRPAFLRRRCSLPSGKPFSPPLNPPTLSGGAIDEALRCRESREAKTILFGLTGTGYFDMTAYENYLNGKMSDSIPTDADLQKGFDSLPKIPQNEGI